MIVVAGRETYVARQGRSATDQADDAEEADCTCSGPQGLARLDLAAATAHFRRCAICQAEFVRSNGQLPEPGGLSVDGTNPQVLPVQAAD